MESPSSEAVFDCQLIEASNGRGLLASSPICELPKVIWLVIMINGVLESVVFLSDPTLFLLGRKSIVSLLEGLLEGMVASIATICQSEF